MEGDANDDEGWKGRSSVVSSRLQQVKLLQTPTQGDKTGARQASC